MAIQFRRGPESDLDVTQLKQAEPAFCTDTKRAYVGNGDGTATPMGNMFEADYANGSGGSNPKKVDRSTSSDTVVGVRSYAIFPVGHTEFTHATSAPSHTLLEQGQLVSRTTYSDLWAWAQAYTTVVSDSDWNNNKQGCFSSGDGSTTFRLPDMRGRVPVGYASGDSDFGTLGKTGGSKTGRFGLNGTGWAQIVIENTSNTPVRANRMGLSPAQAWSAQLETTNVNSEYATRGEQNATPLDGTTNAGSLLQPYAVGNWLIVY